MHRPLSGGHIGYRSEAALSALSRQLFRYSKLKLFKISLGALDFLSLYIWSQAKCLSDVSGQDQFLCL